MNSSVILSVGEAFHLKTGKDWILYGGMPSDDVFSVIQKKQNGYQGYAWNLFFFTEADGDNRRRCSSVRRKRQSPGNPYPGTVADN